MSELNNKVVLITGATSGIGKETALAFAKAGARVAITGRREKEGNQVVEEIKELGAEGFFVRADTSIEADVAKMTAAVVENFSEINAAFINAGVWGDPQEIVNESQENIDSVIDINVKGVILALKHIAPEIAKSGGGSIVTNSSILGMRAMPGFSVYNASKFAVVGLTKTAALELSAQNIRVNCVAPGPIETDMLNSASGGDPSAFGQMIPMGRIGQPKEIAEAVLWLASDKSSYVNGQIIAVDGGYTAG